jgi:hypothetical protein
MHSNHPVARAGMKRRAIATVAAAGLLLSVFGGSAQAANSRDFSVTVGAPTPASQGGATKFDIDVVSTDNQTIANVVLSVPAAGETWPAGLTITGVIGADASACAPTNGTSLSCDFGNLGAYGSRSISIIAGVGSSVAAGDSVVFTASAETNNENGANRQVVSGTSTALHVVPFSANSLTTFKLNGSAGTSKLGDPGAGNLQTTLNLLSNNGGKGNTIAIVEGTNATQPAYCVSLKLECQPDYAEVSVNAGAAVSPYLETILTAQVPKKFNLKKAFVIHVLDDGTVESGFPLTDDAATSCALHPTLVPCADFSLVKSGGSQILTITLHTKGNGKFQF